MIVETNVLSEVMRPAPSAEVTSWLRRRESTFHVSVVTVQELARTGRRTIQAVLALSKFSNSRMDHLAIPGIGSPHYYRPYGG